MAEEFKWSWGKLVKGFLSKSFIAVVIATAVFVIYFLGVFSIRNEMVDWIIATVWGSVLIIFVFSRALEHAIENMKITAEIKAGAQANINADTAKVIEAIREVGK